MEESKKLETEVDEEEGIINLKDPLNYVKLVDRDIEFCKRVRR